MQTATEAAKSCVVSIEEAWSELERELQVRARCFDNWVKDGRLAWAEARDRMARLGAASAFLKAVIDQEPALVADLCKALKITPPQPSKKE